MKRVLVIAILCYNIPDNVFGQYPNETLGDAVQQQVLDFRKAHPKPIGIQTTSSGRPVEVRETNTVNTDIFNNPYFWDLESSADQERIPQRPVHARGTGAYGYFEVTNDVSQYTSADVFNGIGKKTPVAARFSYLIQSIGGMDLVRETVGFATKFYTNEGNLDLLSLSFPVFLYKSPHVFGLLNHGFQRNPKTNIIDSSIRLDEISLNPEIYHQILWLVSDYGIPNGYRKFNAFPIHAFELVNKHGESYFARFSFNTEQGVELLAEEAAAALRSYDPDYAVRDLYDAIAAGNYPAWRLDMDIIPKSRIVELDYNPFDVNTLWRNGTYTTVTIGRLILNRNPDNQFKDVEQAAYNPGNLVPGIPGPVDDMFKARRFAYRDAQNYRLGINHNNIEVNQPKYSNTYNRDGVPPVLDNMKDVPNYYQNSFNGPAPYVDVARPKEAISIKFRQSVDLEDSANFYNVILKTEGRKSRLASNIANIMALAIEPTRKMILRVLYLIDPDLGARAEAALPVSQALLASLRPKLVVIEENPRTYSVLPTCIP